MQATVSDQHPNAYLDQQQTQTSMHENVPNGYAVFHSEDSQLVQPKLEQIYDQHSTIGYECYMPPVGELHPDQVCTFAPVQFLWNFEWQKFMTLLRSSRNDLPIRLYLIDTFPHSQ
jgi:hypothetical protein